MLFNLITPAHTFRLAMSANRSAYQAYAPLFPPHNTCFSGFSHCMGFCESRLFEITSAHLTRDTLLDTQATLMESFYKWFAMAGQILGISFAKITPHAQ